MKLLEKTRKINKLLQKGDKVEFNAIAKLLRDVIEANTYIVGRKGGVKGYARFTSLNAILCVSRFLTICVSLRIIWALL